MRSAMGGSGPSPAERARTTLACAPTLTLEVDGCVEVVDLRAVRPDGTLVVLVPSAAEFCVRVAERPGSALLQGARLSPLVVPDRMLDRVRVQGRVSLLDTQDLGAALALVSEGCPDRLEEVLLRPDAMALVRVVVLQVWLDDAAVEPAAYRLAHPDPLAAESDEIVVHLLLEHAEELGQLAHLLDPGLLRTTRVLAPVCVDRYGLTFRLAGDHGVALTRLNFLAALRGPAELSVALRELQSRAAQVMCRCCPRSDRRICQDGPTS